MFIVSVLFCVFCSVHVLYRLLMGENCLVTKTLREQLGRSSDIPSNGC